jgi:hypothetical protein
MRDTLITGLLVCLPTAVLLASAAGALLVSKLRREVNGRFHHPGTTQAGMSPPLTVTRSQEEICDDATLTSVPTGRLRVVVQVRDCLFLPVKNVSARG